MRSSEGLGENRRGPIRVRSHQLQLRDFFFCIAAYAFVLWFASGLGYHLAQTSLVLALQTLSVLGCLIWKSQPKGNGKQFTRHFSMRAGIQLTTISSALFLSWLSLFVFPVPIPIEFDTQRGLSGVGAAIGFLLFMTLWHLVFGLASAFLAMCFLVSCLKHSIFARVIFGINAFWFLISAVVLLSVFDFGLAG